MRWFMLGVMLAVVLGCDRKPNVVPADADQKAEAKVNAMKRLAEEMKKSPDSGEARGALEEFRFTSMDIQLYKTQADEIRDIYRQQIQGKYKGFVAQEIQGEMGPFLVTRKAK